MRGARDVGQQSQKTKEKRVKASFFWKISRTALRLNSVFRQEDSLRLSLWIGSGRASFFCSTTSSQPSSFHTRFTTRRCYRINMAKVIDFLASDGEDDFQLVLPRPPHAKTPLLLRADLLNDPDEVTTVTTTTTTSTLPTLSFPLPNQLQVQHSLHLSSPRRKHMPLVPPITMKTMTLSSLHPSCSRPRQSRCRSRKEGARRKEQGQKQGCIRCSHWRRIVPEYGSASFASSFPPDSRLHHPYAHSKTGHPCYYVATTSRCRRNGPYRFR